LDPTLVRGFPELVGCTPTLSIFAVYPSPVLVSSTQEPEPEVTGAYEPYVEPMELAIMASNGGVTSVQSAVDPIIAQAILDGVPEGDILALAAMGSLAVSSAVEWNGFDWAMLGGGERCDSISCNMMSVVRQENWDNRVLKVVVADATGCLSGVKKWDALRVLLMTPALKAVAGYCGVRGAIGHSPHVVSLIVGGLCAGPPTFLFQEIPTMLLLSAARVILVGLVAFGCFSLAIALGGIGSVSTFQSFDSSRLVLRAVSALLLAVALVLGERRFPSRSAMDAAKSGLVLGVIIAACDIVFDPARAEPARSVAAMLSLPLLTMLTYWAQRFGTTSRL
jgi:hypothetical protein